MVTLRANDSVGAPTTCVLSNHDVVRHASRLGLARTGRAPEGIGAQDEQPDARLGLQRARAVALLTLALPGSAYPYQRVGLGLPEHTTLADEVRRDPGWLRSGRRGVVVMAVECPFRGAPTRRLSGSARTERHGYLSRLSGVASQPTAKTECSPRPWSFIDGRCGLDASIGSDPGSWTGWNRQPGRDEDSIALPKRRRPCCRQLRRGADASPGRRRGVAR
jgi:hypothetical protein